MKRYSLFIIIILSILKILVLNSCANIIPPGGGLRDTLPPVLVEALPKDSALHFNAKKITLTFNEYVQLDNSLQTNLIVSPNPDVMPYVSSHLKEVTIRLKDSLKPNTTYAINFGNTLKDVNEGNPYKNFTYVFSTGNTLAGGTLKGKVVLAQTGTSDSTLIVILHNNLNDSAIKRIKPDYYTRLDSAGRFNFRFIANGIYAVYVLPNDYTKKYDDSTKMFSFLNGPVTIDSNEVPEPVMMYAYRAYPENKNANNTSAANTNTANKKKPADTTKTIMLTTNLQRGTQDLLSGITISFNEPLAKFDSSKISLTDTFYHPVTNYKITADTSFKTFTLQYPWKENEYFKLIVQQDAFADSAGKMLAKNDTINFKTSSESEYGSIRLRFADLDLSRNPVLQFVQNDKIVDSVALTKTELYRKLYKPGDYDLRILYDEDKNLTWTPGNFELKKQPEIVIRIPRKLTIKENWDNEVNINL
ncbi:MAG: Ig-like domain-containing protein [Parafilimonas sp.]